MKTQTSQQYRKKEGHKDRKTERKKKKKDTKDRKKERKLRDQLQMTRAPLYQCSSELR
jgi:hypothetical protein